jgi:hypothetical protein
MVMPEIRFPTVVNPVDHVLYVDDPYQPEPTYNIPLIDCAALYENQQAGPSVSASNARLERIYFNNDNGPKYNFLDLANTFYDKVTYAQRAPTRKEQLSLAAAIITSLDFPDFQNQNVIGMNIERAIRTGILTNLFEQVQLPNLTGKWAALSNDLKYHRNLGETVSPQPSKGTGVVTQVTVQKHGGAVAITQRAEMVINGDNPFQRFVTQMQEKRQFDENDMVADVIEAVTTPTIAGVDFGARTGSPPVSQTNPIDFINNLVNTFEAQSQPLNLFISRAFVYNEYITNDIVRGGANNVPPTQTNVNESTGPFPLMSGVTWARDNAITSNVNAWAMNSNAIKVFRGPSRNYTIADEDTETTRYVTKNYMLPSIVDPTLIYLITGIAA